VAQRRLTLTTTHFPFELAPFELTMGREGGAMFTPAKEAAMPIAGVREQLLKQLVLK